jgi:hypothetical protein
MREITGDVQVSYEIFCNVIRRGDPLHATQGLTFP